MNRYKGGYQIIKLNDVITVGEDISENNIKEFKCIEDWLKIGNFKPFLLNIKFDNGENIIVQPVVAINNNRVTLAYNSYDDTTRYFEIELENGKISSVILGEV